MSVNWNDYTDQATRDMFRSVWGDQAEQHWLQEDRQNHPERYGSSGGSSGGSGSKVDPNDIRDGMVESAGNKTIAQNDLRNYQQGELKVKRDELKQLQKQFEATLAYKMKTLKLDRDRLAVDRGTAFADAWYKQEQVRLADQTHQLAMSQLGLDYLKTDVEYRSSPDNYFKLADFEAGARARQDVPLFLQGLQQNVQGAAYQAPGGMPTSQGIGSGIEALGGSLAPGVGQTWTPPNGGIFGGFKDVPSQYQTQYQTQASAVPGVAQPVMTPQQASAATVGSSGTEGWNAQDVSALNAIGQLMRQGAHKLAPGALESLSSDNRALLGAGIARLGGSARSFMEQYQKSRPGQGNTQLA